ncbi:hypothetical protein AN639_10090 [Candidatus Epulonipiscium fishelsonii]|uniref:Uncharacterized protein n=1 Tax=Candidatus Epulonipiscium fishelsonii TaxID=77094 RepID=A0ACC8X8F3_9FIRM|nr:hypothetical protein AN396_11250 [Epulopiscium sp. SCG-B11WGA-EpuloA1]ONI43671.1 hypothetical protein AN639_10090 [Epulopiscium sp. SCG-B05WGA-EpuloA1]
MLAYGTSAIIMFILAYFYLPVFNLSFFSLYLFISLFLVISGLVLIGPSRKTISIPNIAKTQFSIVGFIILLTIIIGFAFGSPIFRASAYHNLIGDVAESEFSADISPVSTKDVRLVDRGTAIRLGEKKIGEVPGLGSIAKLGIFNIQNVDGQLYWVAPLVHQSFIKWITNLDGCTGYIMVSATNPQDVRFVQTINNEPINIIYQPEAYLEQDLARHIYLNGNFTQGLTDFTFEINDSGEPYWVVTLYTNKIGFNGANATGVVTVHAQSGEVNKYTIEDAPAWIDRIQPDNFIFDQLYNWGIYVDGFFNAVFGQQNVLVPTAGISLVYGSDGNSYWYTGMTSAGADEATVGFVLTNTRTKETKFYKQPGATEIAAQRSAEGKVQEKGYIATEPIMYNVSGIPTYVMSLLDKAGLIKMVAFVSVEDYSILGVGETTEEALRNYKSALASTGNDITIGSSVNSVTLYGVITRLNMDVQNGDTYYYLMLDSAPDKIFISTSNISSELPLSREGDDVSLSFDDYGESLNNLTTFDNLDLSISLLNQ